MRINSLLSEKAKDLLSVTGPTIVEKIGNDVIRAVVLDILMGKNIRDSTENITRQRIARLNLELMKIYVEGSAEDPDFAEKLLDIAENTLNMKKISKQERWVAEWIIGLTDKAFQNVLRDDKKAIEEYKSDYKSICLDVMQKFENDSGEIKGEISLGPEVKAEINTFFVLSLLNTVGSETLTIRGSEKSVYGKLFEKLVLGSLLHILGFKLVSEDEPGDLKKVFWLSSRKSKRESDATLIFKPGKGVRFDIGFIGRGNPEISLDKVSRFAKDIEIGNSRCYMATFIIVDRIGENSRIATLAKDIDGTIIQMSMGYWPQLIALELNNVLGYKHPIIKMNQTEVAKFLKKKIQEVPFGDFIQYIE